MSASTGLLTGARSRGEGGAAEDTSVVLLRDYKRIGGRMVHTTMLLRVSGTEIVTRTIHLDHDRIDPAKFKPPPAVPEATPNRGRAPFVRNAR